MELHQKTNHFPGMFVLSRKSNLARNLTKMKKAFPEYYNFFPKTWLLPAESGKIMKQFNKKGSRDHRKLGNRTEYMPTPMFKVETKFDCDRRDSKNTTTGDSNNVTTIDGGDHTADYGKYRGRDTQETPEREDRRKPVFILKPESGSQGNGIYIVTNLSDIPLKERCVVQRYITKYLFIIF